MEPPRYPTGTVRALLASDLVTPVTREVLVERLEARPKAHPRFFDAASFATLRAACERLIPQPERSTPIDLAGAVDERLARNEGNGWRYATMPPDRDAYQLGLRGIDECASLTFGAAFVDLDGARQDDVLRSVQDGKAEGASWVHVPAARFFEELLAELVESYYSHPVAQEEIGYAGFADAHGWQAMGLDTLEKHEPRPIRQDLERVGHEEPVSARATPETT
jgi:gluconate 2-dehydrogenase gamma chain